MAPQIPTTEPSELVAGDTWEWTKSLADYPATEGWELSYFLRSGSAEDSDLDIEFGESVQADGRAFAVSIAAESTEGLTSGPYSLVGRVTDGSTTKTLPAVRVFVHPNPATATGAPSFARQMRDAHRTQALTVAGAGTVSMSVNGRSLTYATPEEFRAALAHYEYLVALEESDPDTRLSHAVAFVDG